MQTIRLFFRIWRAFWVILFLAVNLWCFWSFKSSHEELRVTKVLLPAAVGLSLFGSWLCSLLLALVERVVLKPIIKRKWPLIKDWLWLCRQQQNYFLSDLGMSRFTREMQHDWRPREFKSW
ncbi:MAG: hypothetical protein EOP06_05905 [Proteobacteria bacterium]|nr:MAG: hypothetical protein EOP06_05905 [Pseudomonadota bacterium]